MLCNSTNDHFEDRQHCFCLIVGQKFSLSNSMLSNATNAHRKTVIKYIGPENKEVCLYTLFNKKYDLKLSQMILLEVFSSLCVCIYMPFTSSSLSTV